MFKPFMMLPLGLSLLVASVAAHAVSDCASLTLPLWSGSKDGIRIFKSPHAHSRVVGTLKSAPDSLVDTMRPLQAVVIASAGGRFLVNRIVEPDPEGDQQVFSGAGWIDSKHFFVRGARGGSPLLKAPATEAARSGTLTAETSAVVLQCRTTWLQVRSRAGRPQGWAEASSLCLHSGSQCQSAAP